MFNRKDPLKEMSSKEKKIFNFLNLYSLWLFENNKLFRIHILKKENMNFPDGAMIQRKIKSNRVRGPAFTKRILISDIARNKKHFFIGLEDSEIEKLSKVIGIESKQIGAYNPPFINGIEFSKEKQEKIIKSVNNFKTDYLWICIGNPKQEILSNQIFDSVKVDKIFNVGAALDFLLGRKKESPLIFRKLGVEWLYRFIIDFKYSKKKVWRSFVALKYLRNIN